MRRKRIRITVKKNCPFCKGKMVVDYKQVEPLKKYISEKGKILGRNRTGLCQKHQSRVGQAIKRARHLALLPFVNLY